MRVKSLIHEGAGAVAGGLAAIGTRQQRHGSRQQREDHENGVCAMHRKHSTTRASLPARKRNICRSETSADLAGSGCGGVASQLMDEANHSKRAVLTSNGLWAFWGVATALLITLSDRYNRQHFESPVRILFRFAIFVGFGVLFGRVMSTPLARLTRVRFALLVSFIFVVAYILWRMATGQ